MPKVVGCAIRHFCDARKISACPPKPDRYYWCSRRTYAVLPFYGRDTNGHVAPIFRPSQHRNVPRHRDLPGGTRVGDYYSVPQRPPEAQSSFMVSVTHAPCGIKFRDLLLLDWIFAGIRSRSRTIDEHLDNLTRPCTYYA